MPRWFRLLTDPWSSLDYKERLHYGMDRPWVVPTWVAHHARRLETYKYLAALMSNKGREYIHEAEDRREYGDAAVIVNIVRSAVTGDDVSLSVTGAADLSDDKNATPAKKAEAAAATARLDELNEWADDERLQMKVVETERDAVGLGDGVYALGINHEKGRVRLRCYDPGFYFPYIDPNDPEDEFPKRVDIAWEYRLFAGDFYGESVVKVHRITWELGRIQPTANEDGTPGELQIGDTVDDRGRIVRLYPWNDQPSPWTCYLTDAVWEIGDLNAGNNAEGGQMRVDTFPLDKAEFVANEEGLVYDHLDLRLDFVPVVHLPNNVAVKAHYGQSILSSVAQLLDDMSAADTDAASAAALAGTPILGTSGPSTGSDGEPIEVRPGLLIGNLGQGGKLDVVDLSRGLTALLAYIKELRDRLSVNTRIPPEVLGRIESSSRAVSGVKVALSFGPLRGLVEEMRLVRKEKYNLLLKFLQRMEIAAGFWSGDVLDANITFGSFLPSDQTSTIDAVLKLFAAHLISRKTAIAQLVEEGIIDVDLADELEACEAEDFTAALAYFEATDDVKGTFDLLHHDQPPPPALPPPGNLPPAPGMPALPPGQPAVSARTPKTAPLNSLQPTGQNGR